MHYNELAMRFMRGQRLARLSFLAVALASGNLLAQAARRTGEVWQIVPQPQSSEIFARDGSLMGEVGSQIRSSVSIRTLPRYVGQAFVAVEDQRFYQHDGVDVVGIAGAIKDNILGDRRGASTITRNRSSKRI